MIEQQDIQFGKKENEPQPNSHHTQKLTQVKSQTLI